MIDDLSANFKNMILAGKLSKTKGVSNKISNPNRTNSRQSTDKSKSTFQTPIKRNLSFLQEVSRRKKNRFFFAKCV